MAVVSVPMRGVKAKKSRMTRLVTPGLGTLRCPWWPEALDVSNMGREWIEQERPGRKPLLLNKGRYLPQTSVSFIVSGTDPDQSVWFWLKRLRKHANSKHATTLITGKDGRGRWQITALSWTETQHTKNGYVSEATVDLTLTRVSEASVPIGPVGKRKKKRKKKGR